MKELFAKVGVGAIAVVFVLAVLAFTPWIIMLVWGGLASAFGFSTISFWTAVLVTIALTIVCAFFKSTVVK